MSAGTWNRIEPVSSGEMPIVDTDRLADIDQKHEQITDFLGQHGYDALLLSSAANFSWFTSGGDCSRAGTGRPTAAIFITRDARVLVTGSVDSQQLFDRELPAMGFQLKERSWVEPRHLLIDDLCRGRSVASDGGVDATHDVSLHLQRMRIPLSLLECQRIRELGRHVAHAVEATARNFERGQTEAEIAGQLANRLIKHRILPERLQVFADLQGLRYPHWSYGNDRVERNCVIAALGRRHGLCVAAARSVSFGKSPDEITAAHHHAMLASATALHFSQPEWEVFEIWNRLVRIYEKFGEPDAWLVADQGEVLAYEACEVPIVPKSEFRLEPRMPVHWHPSVGPAITGDTILVGDGESELITPAENWPKLQIHVKGTLVERPAILRRDA